MGSWVSLWGISQVEASNSLFFIYVGAFRRVWSWPLFLNSWVFLYEKPLVSGDRGFLVWSTWMNYEIKLIQASRTNCHCMEVPTRYHLHWAYLFHQSGSVIIPISFSYPQLLVEIESPTVQPSWAGYSSWMPTSCWYLFDLLMFERFNKLRFVLVLVTH